MQYRVKLSFEFTGTDDIDAKMQMREFSKMFGEMKPEDVFVDLKVERLSCHQAGKSERPVIRFEGNSLKEVRTEESFKRCDFCPPGGCSEYGITEQSEEGSRKWTSVYCQLVQAETWNSIKGGSKCKRTE